MTAVLLQNRIKVIVTANGLIFAAHCHIYGALTRSHADYISLFLSLLLAWHFYKEIKKQGLWLGVGGRGTAIGAMAVSRSSGYGREGEGEREGIIGGGRY